MTLAPADAAFIWTLAVIATAYVIGVIFRSWADRARYKHRAANYRAEAELLRAKREVMGRNLTEDEADV